MNGLKVGDKVMVKANGTYVRATIVSFGKAKYGDLFPIDVVYEDGHTNSYTAKPDLVILEDLYNSPLYKALK